MEYYYNIRPLSIDGDIVGGLPWEGYIILYRVTADRIEIVRVANVRQDLRSLFDISN